MSIDGLGTKRHINIAENFNSLSKAHERYRRQTDRQTERRAIAYSERERDVTTQLTFVPTSKSRDTTTRRNIKSPA